MSEPARITKAGLQELDPLAYRDIERLLNVLLSKLARYEVLSNYVSGPGVITAADTILSAIQKLNGNDATNANLTGPITSIGNATAVASQTGTGSTFAMQASPSFTGNVGIGAASASGTRLEVASTGEIARFYGNSGNSNIAISDNNNVSTVAFGSIFSGNAYVYSLGYVALYAGGAERLRVASNGNVGIGVTAPTAKLHLAAGTAATAPLKIAPGALLTTLEQGAIEYTDNGTTGALYMTMSVAGALMRRQIL